jgi:hypothetical protein
MRMAKPAAETALKQSQRQSGEKTYLTSVTDSFSEYCSNAQFRRLLDSGAFTFVKPGHYVIANPKYIQTTDTGIELTDYARTHLDECCLRFMLKLVKGDGVSGARSASVGVAEGEAADGSKAEAAAAEQPPGPPARKPGVYTQVPVLDPGNHNLAVFQRSQELRKLHDDLIDQSRRLADTEMNFAQLAAWHIKNKGYNKAVFQAKTLLSRKTYERIMSNQLPNPTLETVMAICIGLQLSIKDSELLLERAGYKLSSSPQHLAYHKLLSAFVGHSLFECNEILEALSLSPLTAKPRSDISRTSAPGSVAAKNS